MTKRVPRSRAPAALPMLEDAVRLLRSAPPSALVLHALGSVPCLLYAVYFYTDLSRSAFAADRLLASSLTLASLYAWMKCWQSIAVAHLRASLLGQAAPTWNVTRLTQLCATQILLQPIGLIIRFIAAVIAIPYVWVATFFQNVTVLGDGTAGVGEVASAAWQEARRWPGRAHALAGYLFLFGFFIFLNLLALLAIIPLFLKSLLGIETVVSRYLLGLLNPTSFVAVFAMTYLCLDPLRKAAFTLRCFHGRSLRTGEDLAVEIQRLHRPATAIAALLAAMLTFAPLHVRAADAPPPPVRATQLDESIDGVLGRREFAWRAAHPSETAATVKESAFQKWVHDLQRSLSRLLYNAGRALKRWFRSLVRRPEPAESSHSTHWFSSARTWLWIALAGSSVVLIALLIRRSPRRKSGATEAVAMVAAPDLREENVTADQLAEDGWLRLASELLERGEFRLALRAFYLAGLAHLGSRELIHLARHKSNRDYDRELHRRARSREELLAAFERNLQVFERTWYGDHAIDAAGLRDVSANLERIRAC